MSLDAFDNHFCNELNEYLQDYEKHLTSKGLTKSTIDKHGHLISVFIDFIDNSTSVAGFEDITKAHLNSKFRAYLKYDYQGEFSDTFISYAQKEYFGFILDKYGISTPIIKSALNIK